MLDIKLQEWINGNLPSTELVYCQGARNQMFWVRDFLSYMIWNSLRLSNYDECKEGLTVCSTHVSKSITLPVYKFSVRGIDIYLRNNFHDWCVKSSATLTKDFPSYMHINANPGHFEGMENIKANIEFCVRSDEQLYAILWWMLNEGIT